MDSTRPYTFDNNPVNWVDPWGLSASDGQQGIKTVKNIVSRYYGDYKLKGALHETANAKVFYGSLGCDFRPWTGNTNVNIELGIAKWKDSVDFFNNKNFNLGLSGSAEGIRGDAFIGAKDGRVGLGADASVFKASASVDITLGGWKIKIGGEVMTGGIGGQVLLGKKGLKLSADIGFGVGFDISWDKVGE